MKSGVLYLSYSGMLEPLGQSQVLAYQERLAAGHAVHLVSFERPADWARQEEREQVAQRMQAAGIHWHPLRYHKRFSLLATLWDIAVGIVHGWRLVRRHGLGIVHARSYVPAVMALVIKHMASMKFLFDMRGFWVDERVDGGLWKRGGLLYRGGKWIERKLLRGADHVVSLTHAAVRVMRDFDYLQARMPPMTVIPTCVDLKRFRPLPKPDAQASFTLGYVGSVGTWYLFDAAVLAFRVLLETSPDARFLIVNKGAHPYIRERISAAGVPDHCLDLREASHARIPELMAKMDAGVFFIKPLFSKQASAPTKLAEFLGCGIPCLSNAGVGDMAQVLEQDRVGVAVAEMDEAGLRAGMRELLAMARDPGIEARCVASAERHFSLEEGVRRYQQVYESLSRSVHG